MSTHTARMPRWPGDPPHHRRRARPRDRGRRRARRPLGADDGQQLRADGLRRGPRPGAYFVDLDTELAARPVTGGATLPDPARRRGAAPPRPASPRAPVSSRTTAGSRMPPRGPGGCCAGLGITDVRVLDGGYAAWLAAGVGLDRGAARPARRLRSARRAPAGARRRRAAALARDGLLLDARAPERYRGEAEPIDPVAGHIPGRAQRPHTALGRRGRFLSAGTCGSAAQSRASGRRRSRRLLRLRRHRGPRDARTGRARRRRRRLPRLVERVDHRPRAPSPPGPNRG